MSVSLVNRRFTGRVAVAAMLGLLSAGCERGEQGTVAVTLIAPDLPGLVDPASRAISDSEGVLLENAAQGLVRFDSEGNIEGGLAERWNVSDDGLSYIFRLQTGKWPSGRKISAQDVARLLRRQLVANSRNTLKDTFGAVGQIVAMTDRVLAIELKAPRPHLLQLLAQPEFALLREGEGSGPFTFAPDPPKGEQVLTRTLPQGDDGAEPVSERVALSAAKADAAVRSFKAGTSSLVLGGTFADLGIAIGQRVPRVSLRFDPVAGLFGLVAARKTGPAADPKFRALIDRAIDRAALVAALGVPDLNGRATLLQPGLDGGIAPATPAWAAVPLAERRAALMAEARALLPPSSDGTARPPIRIQLPEGPGAAILLARLRADWAPLGLTVEPSGKGKPADFRLIDKVAPSVSPAWFLRQFRCGQVPVCLPDADTLLDDARLAAVTADRNSKFAKAEALMRAQTLFIPIAAPVRWSLVARGIPGFVENRFARHPLTALREARTER